MKKTFSILCIFVLAFMFLSGLQAQPQYYNYEYTEPGQDNSFPFNQAPGKMIQTLIPAGGFGIPTPAPGGNITSVSFRISNTYPLGPATYTGFKVLFAQTTVNVLPTGSFFTGPFDTVYYRASAPLTAAAGTWLTLQLDHTFTYDPTKSLVIEIEQCGATGSGLSATYSLGHRSSPGFPRRSYSTTATCTAPYQGISSVTTICGINVAPAYLGPNYIHYKFENNPSATTVLNCAIPGVGTNPAPFTVHTLGSGGQFDSCLVGTGGTNSGIATGWLTNLGSGSWTISMWLNDLPNNTTLYYLWGESTGSFRCFLGGAAGAGNIVLRGTGITDVNVAAVAPGPTVVHYVYDSAASQIRAYKNGVLSNTVNQTPLNLATGTGFKVGAYSTSAGLNGKMDEFRVYKRKLDSAEISATWNQDLACQYVVGINQNNNQIPEAFSLSQNYPNPFNPTTMINFGLAKGSNIKLIVYDILGREVEVLVSGYMVAGNYAVDFDAHNLASGVYMYKLVADGFTATKKMLLIK